MGFGGEVHDDVWLKVIHDLIHALAITDVSLKELVAGMTGDAFERFQIACVGKLIDVEYVVLSIINEVSNDGGSNETGATSDNYFFHRLVQLLVYGTEFLRLRFAEITLR